MIDLTAGRAANTHLRRHLMLEIKSALDSRNLTQVEAATAPYGAFLVFGVGVEFVR
ncbi:hypothetical protein N2488_02880 [SAR92 clade bacterium H231]|nr:hypothetical protein [SAR92 clade bacterium H231]